MGISDWLRRRGASSQRSAVDAGAIHGPRWKDSDEWRDWDPPLNIVVGESYRQDAIRRIAKAGPPREQGYLVPVDVTLRRDPKNKHDANAIRAEVAGTHVGFIRKDIAAVLSPSMRRMGVERFTVCGVVRGAFLGRWDSLGVHVWLDERPVSGPALTIDGDLDGVEVDWPPDDDEGRA